MHSCRQGHGPLSLIVTYLNQTHLLSHRPGQGVVMMTSCGWIGDVSPGGCFHCCPNVVDRTCRQGWPVTSGSSLSFQTLSYSLFWDRVVVPCGGQAPLQWAQVPDGKRRPRTAEWGAFTWVAVAPIVLAFGVLD